MASAADPPLVAKHDDEHLRRFLSARAAGDTAQTRLWWNRLVEDFYDRIVIRVRVEAAGGKLDRDEQDDVVQLALESFSKFLLGDFDGSSMGELVNAMKTIVMRRRVDVQRKGARDSTVPLDGSWTEHEDPDRPAPAWEYGQAERRREDDETGRHTMSFVAWALPQLPERRQEVARLMFAAATTEEIRAALGVSEQNAHQLCSRTAKALRDLKEQYDA